MIFVIKTHLAFVFFSLFSGSLMARSTGIFVNGGTTSNATNLQSASGVSSLTQSENSKEFLTVLSNSWRQNLR